METRRGKNTRHLLVGLLRQSVFGRLAGYEDVNDADRLSQDPVMRAIVDRKGLDRLAASASQMGRFETEWLATDDNLAALTDLSGVWIDRVHKRKPPKMIVLDMDSSVSPACAASALSCATGPHLEMTPCPYMTPPPCVVRDGRYIAPAAPGYSITMHPDSLRDYDYPQGSAWR